MKQQKFIADELKNNDPFDLSDLADDHTRYLIKDSSGEFTIDVPSTWKVTYGHLHPGGGRDPYGKAGNVLRLYENKEKQRAVFLNVISFRDLSLKVRRQIVAVEEKDERKADGMGNNQRRHEVAREIGWQ